MHILRVIKPFLLTLMALSAFCPAYAARTPNPDDILRAMELANGYFQQHNPDAGAPTFVKKMRPSNLWTRGVYFEGLAALCDIEQKAGSSQLTANLQYFRDWGTAHRWTPRNGVTTRDADDYCCSQAYMWWYEHQSRNDSILAPTIQCVNHLMANAQSRHDWTWIDAIQMGLPVLTRLTKIYADSYRSDAAKPAEQGWQMYAWTRDSLAGGLFNRDEGLWYRDKDFVPPYKEPNGRNCYWSRGNGWVYAALVRAMQSIQESKCQVPHLDDYVADFQLMSKALLSCQRRDGFWNVSLHDQSHFGGKELTGTALFVYGMAWGIRHGLLPEKKYRRAVIKAWQAMADDCLHTDGFLGYVQGTGKQPSDSQPVTYTSTPDFEDFGLGCFLLAGSEMYLTFGSNN